jgi:hypothetical protein
MASPRIQSDLEAVSEVKERKAVRRDESVAKQARSSKVKTI